MAAQPFRIMPPNPPAPKGIEPSLYLPTANRPIYFSVFHDAPRLTDLLNDGLLFHLQPRAVVLTNADGVTLCYSTGSSAWSNEAFLASAQIFRDAPCAKLGASPTHLGCLFIVGLPFRRNRLRSPTCKSYEQLSTSRCSADAYGGSWPIRTAPLFA